VGVLSFSGVGGNSGFAPSSYPYSLHQKSGAWTNPFPDLTINYHTGISFGANPSYEGYSFWDDYSHSTLIFRINGSSNYTYKYTWMYTNTTGYYSDTNGAHFVPNTTSTYGSWNITGNRNGWRGLCFSDGGNTPHLMFDGSSNGGVYFEGGGRWANYYSYNNNCTGFGTSTTNSAFNIYCPTGVYSGGRVDGTIFYDANNTGYYLDPNSTTSIRTVGSWRSDSSTWDGEFSGKIQYHSSHWYLQAADLFIYRNSGGSNVFTINQSGTATASGSITANSDRKLKTNIKTLNNGLEIVSKLRGVRFDWIESGLPSVGMIAQEVEELLPELVFETERNTLEGQESDKIKSLDYSKIVAVLIEAIKEQQTYIKEQDKRIDALENKVNQF
jgi:hypothetical protein